MEEKNGKFRGFRRTGGCSESTFGQKKSGVGKEVIYFECNELGHYKNECPKLKKDRPKKKDFRGKKKRMMATWYDSESSEDDYEEEKTNVALMACAEAPTEKIQSKSKSESDSKEVFI